MEWQPIETAPKDGTFLGWRKYKNIDGGWIECCLRSDGVESGFITSWEHCEVDPTHWMPLPAPPSAS